MIGIKSELRKDCPMRHENGNCTTCGGFCTAVNDPICEGLHNAYDAGWYAALRAQMEAENKPLALDELLEMDGKPVFVTHNKYGEGWCIIDWHGVNKSWTYFSKTGTAEGMTAVPVTAETYGETWLAYRKKHLEHSEV